MKKGKRRRLKAWRLRRDVKRNEAVLRGENFVTPITKGERR